MDQLSAADRLPVSGLLDHLGGAPITIDDVDLCVRRLQGRSRPTSDRSTTV